MAHYGQSNLEPTLTAICHQHERIGTTSEPFVKCDRERASQDMPPQQAQRMGTRFLHQLTNLGSSGNSSHDSQPQPAGNGSSSPVKNQLASFFQKGPNSSNSTPNYPQQQPGISAPTRAMGAPNTFDSAEDPSLRFGEAFSDGISPNGCLLYTSPSPRD